MARTFTVAAAQMACELGDPAANLAKITGMAKEAADHGAIAVCFPELAVPGYSPTTIAERYYEISEPVSGPSTEALCACARDNGIFIVAGLSERSAVPGKLYNTQITCAPDGSVAAVYRKIHVWGLEKLWWQESCSCEFATFDLPSCRAGTMICYDTNFPETARCLALLGAQVIFDSAAWRVQEADIWDLATRARALDNHAYLVCANLVGVEGETTLNGHSRVIGPRGIVLSELDGAEEGIAYGEVDLDATARESAQALAYLKDRRPEAYGLIADTRDR